jgi:O-antigen ligase
MTLIPARLAPSRVLVGQGPLRTDSSKIPRLVLLAWLSLFVNVLAPGGNPTVVPIPRPLFQAVAQGSLVLALTFALLANRRIVIRPNLFMTLLTALAVSSLVVSLHNEFIVGSVYRGVRLLAFVTCLWLLTPWWGRRDLVLLRSHRVAMWGVLVMVLVGAAIAPGKAFAFEGRLSGTIWPVPPTQVAHYAAVLFGTSTILWMCRVITGRHALAAVGVATIALLGTHTRTALLGALIGVAFASASLFLGHARVRRVSVSTIVGMIAATAVFAPQIVTWLARGQTAEDATQLTGRTKVWSDVFATPRPTLESVFGSGLSNKSFDGLAIDSNWVASYVDQGWFGIVLQAAMLLLLLAMVATHVRGPRRAIALFLTVYVLVSSITETGIGDASPYILDLVVAASLLSSRPPESMR